MAVYNEYDHELLTLSSGLSEIPALPRVRDFFISLEFPPKLDYFSDDYDRKFRDLL